jgi:hypothetical protein
MHERLVDVSGSSEVEKRDRRKYVLRPPAAVPKKPTICQSSLLFAISMTTPHCRTGTSPMRVAVRVLLASNQRTLLLLLLGVLLGHLE